MARKFDQYRVVDGRTRFAASDMNPRLEDIDLRLHAQEVLEKDWEGAIRDVTTFGLRRIDEFIGPAQADIAERLAEAQAAVDAAQAALDALSGETLPISQITGLQAALDEKAGAAQVSEAITSAVKWQVKSAAYTASADEKVAADVSGGAWTLTLPASPEAGDSVEVAVTSGDPAENNLTIDGNGETISGDATLIVDAAISPLTLTLIYNSTEWRIS